MECDTEAVGTAPCRLRRRNAFRRAWKPNKLQWRANSKSRHFIADYDIGDGVGEDSNKDADDSNDSYVEVNDKKYQDSRCDDRLLISDETDPQKYLEKKEVNKGASGKQLTGRGGVLWHLGENVFSSEDQQVVAACFRYYHGPSAVCRSVSPVVQLCKTSQAQQEVRVL